MTCASVMTPDPEVAAPDWTVERTVELLLERRYRSIPVADSDRRLIGVFSIHRLLALSLPMLASEDPESVDRLRWLGDDLEDLRAKLHRHWSRPVSEVMETDVLSVEPDTPLVRAVIALYHTHYNLPVVEADGGRIVGIISYWDVVPRVLR